MSRFRKLYNKYERWFLIGLVVFSRSLCLVGFFAGLLIR